MYLLRRVGNLPLRLVAEMTGISPGRVSQLQQKMQGERLLGRLADIRSLLASQRLYQEGVSSVNSSSYLLPKPKERALIAERAPILLVENQPLSG